MNNAMEIINRQEQAKIIGLAGLNGRNKQKLTKEEKRALKEQKRQEKLERKRLFKLTSKKERRRIARQGKRAQKILQAAGGFVGLLNKAGPATAPLSETEEIFRQASVAGDFNAMNSLAPFGIQNWNRQTPLGKYRFQIQNGNFTYIPFTDFDIDNFLSGPWLKRNPQTGIAPLIHPRRKQRIDVDFKSDQMKKGQEKAKQRFPSSDPRHVYQIIPGTYVYKSGLKSTWVKVRAPVAIAVAIVASVYLGPGILQAVQAAYANAAAAFTGSAAGGAAAGGAAAGGAGGAAAQATLGAKVWAGAKTLTTYVNQGRTVKAMVKGETPPPPIGISGNNFTEWAMAEAKNQIKKEAIERGGKYVAKKLTAKEEAALRREIQEMQRQVAAMIPPNTPMQPSPEVRPEVQQIMLKEKQKAEQTNNVLMFGVPLALAAFLMG